MRQLFCSSVRATGLVYCDIFVQFYVLMQLNQKSTRARRVWGLHAGMKTAGIDQATAKKIMEVWEKTGIEDVSSLRKLLLKRSLTSAGVVGFQTLLDAGKIAQVSCKNPMRETAPHHGWGAALRNAQTTHRSGGIGA